MIDYDASVLQTMAEKLYDRARWVVIRYFMLGGLIGLGGGYAGIATFTHGEPLVALPLGFLGALVGAILASERAFMLRLQAQQLLVQVQIERNTRAR